MLRKTFVSLLLLLFTLSLHAQSPLLKITFDQPLSSDSQGQVIGFVDTIPGVIGQAIQWDGFTSYYEMVPFRQNLPEAFTINAWTALYAYPWFRCPVFDLRTSEKQGVILGVNRDGNLVAALGYPLQWTELTGPQVPLNTWIMLSLTYSKTDGVSLFLNGEQVAYTPIAPKLRNTSRGRFCVGRNALLEPWWDFQYTVTDHYSHWDGPMDEIVLLPEALSGQELKNRFQSAQPLPSPPEQIRRFPGPQEPVNTFGAQYTRLSYTPQWDRLWRVGEYPDVVVQFADQASRLVFWRGTSFVPCWVTENNIWYTNEWTETWGSDVTSCAEPLMDRECRHSHVRILENSPARVVIHWRYALTDADYTIVAQDVDGRGEWCDEYFIIYPDGIGIRKIDLYYSKPLRNHDWEEAIVLLPPGQHPDEVMQDPEVTLMNMAGEKHHYSWRNNLPVEMKEPEKANIHLVNFKSTYKPFYIVTDEPFESKEGKYAAPFFRSYAAFMASDYRPDSVPSIYGWWNHWPITQLPGDGRWVTYPDRASHFNLTTFTQWKDYYMDDRVKSRIMLHGMTDNPDALLPLAKSWLSPPDLISNNKPAHYEPADRAYHFRPSSINEWSLQLKASKEQPAIRPALIIPGTELIHPKIHLNDQLLIPNEDYFVGIERNTDTPKTVIWFDSDWREEIQILIREGL